MEDFFQLIGCITFTFMIGLYIKRFRIININKLFKNKKEYLEIKNNICEDISKISILDDLDIENENENENESSYNHECNSIISDISSSNSDDEFIIIEDT